MKRKLYIYLLTCLTFCIACKSTDNKISNTELIQNKANAILLALDKKDKKALEKFIHPKLGIYFSPYVYVNKKEDLHVSKKEFLAFASSEEKRTWGRQDGTGNPIFLNFDEFIDRYIYKAKYLKAEASSIDSVIGKGNLVNNITEVFPNAKVFESHFSGIDPQYQGMDWCSLRLVFEEYESDFYLVALVNDEWTT